MMSANEILPNLIGNDIKIKYNQDKTAFVADKIIDFRIENLVWDSLGDFFANQGSYRPKYSIDRILNDDNSEDVIVDIEALNSNFEYKTYQESGVQYLLIRREKSVPSN